MESDTAELSCRLYDVLEEVGASEKMRNLHKYLGTIDEIFNRLSLVTLDGCTPGIYRCGSYYEGTVTPDLRSDTDTIVLDERFPVVLRQGDTCDEMAVVMYFDEDTHPGYVKLKPVVTDTYPEVALVQLTLKPDRKGILCCTPIDIKNSNYRKNGPANACDSVDGFHATDCVNAFGCALIPQEVGEWVTRPRSYGWPSQEQLSDMANLGCMVVGVGHKESDEISIEWRLSFSLQERLLMTSLNSVQHKVYILLKMVKKDLIEPKAGPFIKSYQLKTCLFHTIENTPSVIWRRNNILPCLLLCCKNLLRFVEIKNCPNYFWKEQNLFSKNEFRTARSAITMVLKDIRTQGQTFVFSLKSDNIGNLLRQEERALNAIAPTAEAKSYEFALKLGAACSCRACINALNRHGPTDPEQMRRKLENFISSEKLQKPLDPVTREAISFLIPSFHLRLAASTASTMCSTSDQSVVPILLKRYEYHLNECFHSDPILPRLLLSTVLFKYELYEQCFESLRDTAANFDVDIVSLCSCNILSMPRTIYPPDGIENFYGYTMKEIMSKRVAPCMTFLPFDHGVVPGALLCEMYRSVGTQQKTVDKYDSLWFGWAVVDARVYLFFMLYLVGSKLGKQAEIGIAIESIISLIRRDINFGHRETAYNLLGWIYACENRTDLAAECYLRSWQIRPHHNVAKIHMLVLCYQQWTQKTVTTDSC